MKWDWELGGENLQKPSNNMLEPRCLTILQYNCIIIFRAFQTTFTQLLWLALFFLFAAMKACLVGFQILVNLFAFICLISKLMTWWSKWNLAEQVYGIYYQSWQELTTFHQPTLEQNQGFSHTMKSVNPHFLVITTHVVEDAASVNYLPSWTSLIILHMQDVVV